MLHDAGAALAADHAAIDRMVLVAVDVADLAILDVHIDAAAAGAHVAGRLGDCVTNRLRQGNVRFGHGVIASLVTSQNPCFIRTIPIYQTL
jgi:hypothetical protein